MLLILDSGHAEKVTGKKSPDNSFYEWEFNNEMQHIILREAKQLGIDVYLTNPNPENIDEIGLSKRAYLANKYWINKNRCKALFISIHANAYKEEFNSARGVETFIATNASNNTKRASNLIQSEIVNCFKTIDENARDRGIKVKDFTVIYKSSMPSILIEYGFYTNYEDLRVLKYHKEELAKATLKGICKYFDIEYSEDNYYRVVAGSFNNIDNANRQLKLLESKGIKGCFILPKGI